MWVPTKTTALNRIVVYRAECKNTGKMYIGVTHRNFKTRMQEHFKDVRNLLAKGKRSDSYARHFAKVFSNFKKPSTPLQRNSITCSILWQGKPMSVVKTFGSPNCALCAREKLEIFKQSRENPSLLINSCNELYGASLHKPQFHACVKADPSTDESPVDERVPTDKVTTEESLLCRPCLTEV